MHYFLNRFPLLAAALLLAACGAGTAPEAPQRQPGVLLASINASDYTTVVQQLYVSYFGRPADSGGFSNFKSRLVELNAPTDIQQLTHAYKTNAALRELIDSFGNSDESKALYAGDTKAFVDAIYLNLFGRTTGGNTFWSDAIDRGELTRANASLAIMAGALLNSSAQGLLDASQIRNRVSVATSFTASLVGSNATVYRGANAAALARTMLGSVTATTNIALFQTTIDTTLANMRPVNSLYAPVPAIIAARCVACHSASPTLPSFGSFELDTSEQIHSMAGSIYAAVVLSRTMPANGNQTGMTAAERDIIAKWVEAGAP